MCKEEKRFYPVQESGEGVKYVHINDVDEKVSLMIGNDKVGQNVFCYNTSIWYTCRHDCECFKGYIDENGVQVKPPCYAQSGLYMIPDNQAKYTANYKFTLNHTAQELAIELLMIMKSNPNIKKFRWFTCGDFTSKVLEAAVIIAKARPDVEFWAYTKKYQLVNRYCYEHGGRAAIPANLVIVFSHWLNHDGTYFPMVNIYKFPTSEFIPVGMEVKLSKVTYICPCSDPSILANCCTCEHPCYKLQDGQSMALVEHSTKASAARDKETRAAHKALKEAAKAAKEAEKAARKAAKKTA